MSEERAAQGVLGPIPADALGTTLMHEHLMWDFSAWRATPTNEVERRAAAGTVHAGILGTLRFNPCVVPDNLVQDDVEVAVDEIGAFSKAGGRTIVDPTNASLGRDPLALRTIAQRSGLNVIMGCGYYYQLVLGDDFARRRVEDIAAELVRDVTEGVGTTGVRAGIIGEVGTSAPLTALEERSLRASARAQAETGAALMVHLDGWGREGHRVLDLVAEEGGDVGRTVLCHLNPSWFDVEYQHGLLERGAYLEYDMFGIDHFYPPDRASPSELPALEAIAALIASGYRDRLLVSHDVYLKMMLTRYGGYGYAHLLTNLLPYLALAGVTPDDLRALTTDNPRRLLPFL